MQYQSYISFAALLLALGGNIAWALVTYVNSEKKKYAAERDFNHLRNNQKSISDGIAHGFDEIEHKLDALSQQMYEVKAWLIRGSKEKE